MQRSRLIPGVLLIAVGTLFLLDSVGVASAGDIIAGWWPLVIVGIGGLRLLDRPPDLLGGGITAGIGLLLLAMTQGLLTASVLAYLWPLALIGVGLWVMLGQHPRPAGTGDDDVVSAVAIFSGRELRPTSRRFRGGSLFAAFGGVEIDLRGAQLDPTGARLDVTALFGGCDITVPPGWRVRTHGPAVFGAYENGADGQQLPDDAPALDVRILVAFGGAEVKVGAPVSAPGPV
jgi:hypothetical protein